jgi:hypothetical protein
LPERVRLGLIRFYDDCCDNPIPQLWAFIGVLSSLTSIFTFFASGGSGSYSGKVQPFTGFLASLPARMLTYVIIACSIGWTLAWVTAFLSENRNAGRINSGYLFALLASIYLVACAEWMFHAERASQPFWATIMGLAGICICVFLTKTKFRMAYAVDPIVIRVRATVLLEIVVVSGAMILLSQAVRQS